MGPETFTPTISRDFFFFKFQVLKYFLESWQYKNRMRIQNGSDPMVNFLYHRGLMEVGFARKWDQRH